MQRKVDIKIPDHWVQVRVDQISEIIRGVSYKKEVSSDTLLENHLPILRATNIQEDKLILDSDLVFIPEKIIKPDQLLKVGDIVVCISSGSKNLVGKAAQLNNDWIGSFGTFCATIRFKPQVNKKFGGFFFKSPIYREKIKEKSSGININNIRTGHLGEISFPLPPFPEQERIVSKIEELFTQLDAAEAALKRAKNNLKRYQQSLLQAAVTGELTREWREAHKDELEPASKLLEKIKAERRAKWEAEIRAKGKEPAKEKYHEPKEPDTSDPSELPEEWCWVYTELILDYIQYGTSEKANTDSSGIPVLRMGNIQDGELDFGNLKYLPKNIKNIERYYLKPGDILFNRTNSAELVGKTAVFKNSYPKSTFASYLIRVRTNNNYTPDLLAVFTNSLFGKKYISSVVSQQVGQANVNGEKLKKMPIPLPSKAEQKIIIDKINENFYQIEKIHKYLENNINRIELSKRSILQKAFTGQLIQSQTEERE